MILIFDSTPLIYLGLSRALEKVGRLKGRKIIPGKVYKEVVEKGTELGKEEAFYIQRLVEKRVFQVKEQKGKYFELFSKIKGIEEGDAECLALAKELGGVAVMDDEKARNLAEVENIGHGGTVFIIFRMLKEGIIGKKEARDLIDKIIESGWYCSTDLYLLIIKELEKV